MPPIPNPTQNLESYFLNIVNKAREEDQDTSGATSGHQVAEYLRGGKTVKSAADKMLDRLTEGVEKKEPRVVSAPKEETVDTAKLDALADTKPEPKPKPRRPRTVAEAKRSDHPIVHPFFHPGGPPA